jgi:hypothetical protein
MSKYLGETPINTAEHPVYKDCTREMWAMRFIEMYGQIDGDHHKTWVIDQVARILLGTIVNVSMAKWEDGTEEERFETGEPSKDYLAWVEKMLGATDVDGDREYSYDEGIAP